MGKTEASPAEIRVLDDQVEPHVPPGSRLPGAAQSLQWFRDPVRFMLRNQRRHGPNFSVKLGPLSRCSFVAEPELEVDVDCSADQAQQR